MNVCRRQSLCTTTSVRKEARQTALKLGPAMCPDTFHVVLELAGCGGQQSRRHEQHHHLQCLQHSSYQMASLLFAWCGWEGRTVSAHAAFLVSLLFHLQTQSNTATTTSSSSPHKFLPKIQPF